MTFLRLISRENLHMTTALLWQAKRQGSDILESNPNTLRDILWRKMDHELVTACHVTGVLGYHLEDLTTGLVSEFRQNVVFPTASAIKIAVLLGIAAKVHSNVLNWDDRFTTSNFAKVGGSGILSVAKYPISISLWDLASFMVSLSDNTATNICIDLAGMEYVNGLMSRLGLCHTRLRRHMMDGNSVSLGLENTSTPKELSRLLTCIHRRNGVSDPVSADVLGLLELPKPGPFADGLPENVRRANKPGTLNHVSVDAGIIYMPRGPVVLSIMGSFLGGDQEARVTHLVAAAYKYLNLLSSCTEYGRA